MDIFHFLYQQQINILTDLICIYALGEDRKQHDCFDYKLVENLAGMDSDTIEYIKNILDDRINPVDISKDIDLKHKYSTKWNLFVWEIANRIDDILIHKRDAILTRLKKLLPKVMQSVPDTMKKVNVQDFLTDLGNKDSDVSFEAIWNRLQQAFAKANTDVPQDISAYVESIALLRKFEIGKYTNSSQMALFIYPIILQYFYDELLNDLSHPSTKTIPFSIGALELKHADGIRTFTHLSTYGIASIFLIFKLGYCDKDESRICRKNRRNSRGKSTAVALLKEIEENYYNVDMKKSVKSQHLPVQTLINVWFNHYTLKNCDHGKLYGLLSNVHFTWIKQKVGCLRSHINVNRTSLVHMAVIASQAHVGDLENEPSDPEDVTVTNRNLVSHVEVQQQTSSTITKLISSSKMSFRNRKKRANEVKKFQKQTESLRRMLIQYKSSEKNVWNNEFIEFEDDQFWDEPMHDIDCKQMANKEKRVSAILHDCFKDVLTVCKQKCMSSDEKQDQDARNDNRRKEILDQESTNSLNKLTNNEQKDNVNKKQQTPTSIEGFEELLKQNANDLDKLMLNICAMFQFAISKAEVDLNVELEITTPQMSLMYAIASLDLIDKPQVGPKDYEYIHQSVELFISSKHLIQYKKLLLFLFDFMLVVKVDCSISKQR